jgi:hypothetical protein
MHCSKKGLFDHLVGTNEKRWRDGQTDRLRGLEVDYQLEFGGSLDRKVARFFALENPIDICRYATESQIRPIRMAAQAPALVRSEDPSRRDLQNDPNANAQSARGALLAFGASGMVQFSGLWSGLRYSVESQLRYSAESQYSPTPPITADITVQPFQAAAMK